MESSPGEARPVEPDPPDEPRATSTPATRTTIRSRRPTNKINEACQPRRRYSAVVLVVDVVHLLHGQGVPVSESLEHLDRAVKACSDLLQSLGVEPDDRLPTTPREPTAEMVGAALLLRAAGIEPNAIKVWPGPSS